MRKLLLLIPAGVLSVIVILAIAYASLSSDPMGISHIHLFEGADKVMHFLMYFVASVVFITDYAKVRLPHHTRLNAELALTASAMLLGLLMEVGQLVLTPESRSYDILDLVVNCLGALAGFAFLRYCGGMHRYRRMMLSHHYSGHRHRHRHGH